MPRPLSASVSSVAIPIAVVLALVGCTPTPTPTSEPAPSQTATASSAPEPSQTAAPPVVLVPDGSAADNLPYFAATVAQVWAGPDQVAGRAYVDALVAAGFDKAAMQVTADETTVGNAAESIQFAVRWKDACLVGQVGPATGQPVTTVLPALAGDACLVGDTRPIDW